MQILGANGSGKSTLMNCLVNQAKPCRGQVWLAGKKTEELERNQMARLLAYVPQLQNSQCAFRSLDYVVMGRTPYLSALRSPSAADYALADETMERLNLSRLREKRLDQLSGGERQQVQIARALVQEGKIILLDEPANHLDYGVQHRIWELLAFLAEQGRTVIATTHMPDSPLLTGGKVGVFAGGAFLFGTAEELIDGEMLQKIYQVKAKTLWIEPIGRKACFCLPGQNQLRPVSGFPQEKTASADFQ